MTLAKKPLHQSRPLTRPQLVLSEAEGAPLSPPRRCEEIVVSEPRSGVIQVAQGVSLGKNAPIERAAERRHLGDAPWRCRRSAALPMNRSWFPRLTPWANRYRRSAAIRSAIPSQPLRGASANIRLLPDCGEAYPARWADHHGRNKHVVRALCRDRLSAGPGLNGDGPAKSRRLHATRLSEHMVREARMRGRAVRAASR